MIKENGEGEADEVQEVMERTARRLDTDLNGVIEVPGRDTQRYGYCLFVFEFVDDDEGEYKLNYISNAEREDVVHTLEEFIQHNKGRETIN